MNHVFAGSRCIHCAVNHLDALIYEIECVEHEPLVFIVGPEGTSSNVGEEALNQGFSECWFYPDEEDIDSVLDRIPPLDFSCK